MHKLITALEVVGLASMVAAHGYVDTAVIGGTEYEFYQPFEDPYTNPAGDGPIEDVDSIDIQCGGWTAGGVEGSEPAALHATAEAGSTVTLHWTLWPESHVGPVMTYMARCPDSGCDAWEPGTDAVFFKVHEEGREGTSDVWGSTPLMSEGSAYEYTIPECLESGYYLVRHETLALHAAWAYPGVQSYPSCHQLEVTGSGSTTPSDLVGFPGAYSPTDPGITYDAYSPSEYIVPGPAVFTC